MITVKVIELKKKSLLGIWKISRLFVNKLTADDKYSLLNRESLMQASQMHLFQKQKTFSEFFCAYLKLPLNIEHFQKKMALIVYVFSKLRSPKHVVK